MTLGAVIACNELNRRPKIALAADCWPDALNVYKTNFTNVESSTTEDLARLVKHPGSLRLSPLGLKLAKSTGSVDIMLAGPPCQGHSDLNNSSRRDDPRNSLYGVPVAFGVATGADILIIENVPTVVHSTGKVVKSAFQALSDRGYAVMELVANAQDFGIPQTRKRHLLVASRLHSVTQLNTILNKIPERQADIAVWPFICDLESEIENPTNLLTKRSQISPDNCDRINYLFGKKTFNLPNRLRPKCHRDKSHSYVSMYGRLNADLPAQTITTGFGSMGQGRFVHPTQRRMITGHEAARIQGFPDYFDFSKAKQVTSLRRMIGNAVPPPVVVALLILLLQQPAAVKAMVAR